MDDASYPDEEWRTIDIAPRYLVSNYGRVKRGGLSLCGQKPKILKPYIREDGHLRVALMGPNGRTKGNIHRLVAIAFLGKPPKGKPLACHKDGKPANNRVGNIYWGDIADNTADRVRGSNNTIGERHGAAKLTDALVRAIRIDPRGNKQIADELNVSATAIWRVKRGVTWKHV